MEVVISAVVFVHACDSVSYDARWLEEKKSDHFNIIFYEKIKFIGFIY